jgi:aminoglycoside phosphotransferase (APT) family kinase protein
VARSRRWETVDEEEGAMSAAHGLADDVVGTITTLAGGTIRRLERAPARREAWLADVERPDGSVVELFVRLAIADDPANSSAGLAKETAIVTALAPTTIPVPQILGVAAEPHVVLFERVPGRSDLHCTPPEQQDAVYRHYMEILGDLHRLDATTLDLPEMHHPVDAQDVALSELRALSAGMEALGPQPLAQFGIEWLRRHAPTRVDRVALLHGDTGIANFMFVDDRVTAAIDWEWAHFGDPMEDLGSAMIHASYSTSGEWPDLLRHYEKASGIPVELDKILYYRAHLMGRSVLALNQIRHRLHPRDPVAFNLCVAIIGDRLLCDALADAMGMEPERPEVPEMPSGTTAYDVVAENLRSDVAGHVDGDFPNERLHQATLMVEMLGRQHALGPWLEATELDELTALLGSRPSDLVAGRAALQELIVADDGRRDEDLVRALGRIAWRAEVVAEPVVNLFPNVALRPAT